MINEENSIERLNSKTQEQDRLLIGFDSISGMQR